MWQRGRCGNPSCRPCPASALVAPMLSPACLCHRRRRVWLPQPDARHSGASVRAAGRGVGASFAPADTGQPDCSQEGVSRGGGGGFWGECCGCGAGKRLRAGKRLGRTCARTHPATSPAPACSCPRRLFFFSGGVRFNDPEYGCVACVPPGCRLACSLAGSLPAGQRIGRGRWLQLACWAPADARPCRRRACLPAAATPASSCTTWRSSGMTQNSGWVALGRL